MPGSGKHISQTILPERTTFAMLNDRMSDQVWQNYGKEIKAKNPLFEIHLKLSS
jgi:hypothetical protein